MITVSTRTSGLTQSVVASPIGPLTLVAADGALAGVYMDAQRHLPPEWALGEPAGPEEPGAAPLTAAAGQLAEYFAGQRTRFELPLALAGTGFQRRVWAALQDIPYGQTISYRELARRTGNAAASPRGRPGQRQEPGEHHRALPSRGRLRRQPDRLRRRHAAQAVPAGA